MLDRGVYQDLLRIFDVNTNMAKDKMSLQTVVYVYTGNYE